MGLQGYLGKGAAADTRLFSGTLNRLDPMDTNLITQRAETYPRRGPREAALQAQPADGADVCRRPDR